MVAGADMAGIKMDKVRLGVNQRRPLESQGYFIADDGY